MNSDESISHYEWVLREADARKLALQGQIAELQREARDLTVTIGGILRLAPPELVARYSSGLAQQQTLNHKNGNWSATGQDLQKFALLSTRWAILLALSESPPISIPDLADQLMKGGFSTDATNFNNNVSSVIGRMKTTKGEVDVADGLWFITEIGRSAITYIKAQKLRRRISRKTETPEDAGTSSGETKGAS